MSLKQIDEEIKDLYMTTCMPCVNGLDFKKGKCQECDVMKDFTALQYKKTQLEKLVPLSDEILTDMLNDAITFGAQLFKDSYEGNESSQNEEVFIKTLIKQYRGRT